MEREVKKCLPLKAGIIYGPVNSRRLGASLGINLSPTQRKICSFNCAYCHYGWSLVVTMDSAKYGQEFPAPNDVCHALEKYLKENPRPDFITFSGNGEPTTHPFFSEIVPDVVKIRDRLTPEVKLTILSNSTTAGNLAIVKALGKLDLRFMKLDCGDHKTFKLFNRPARGITLDGIIKNLAGIGMSIIIQTLIADGTGGNFNEESIHGYLDALCVIKPESVQLYSLDRPTPDGSLAGLTVDQLKELADGIMAVTGIPVKTFGRRSS